MASSLQMSLKISLNSQQAARLAAEEEAAKTKEIMLMILPNDLIDKNRKLKVSVKEFDELLAELKDKLELPDDVFVSNVVGEGETPEPLTSLDDFSAKAKVQVWSPAQMAEAAADGLRQLTLMVLPSPIVPSGRKLSCRCADVVGLRHQADSAATLRLASR